MQCACGCGRDVPRRTDGRQPQFLKGHKNGTAQGTNDPIVTTCASCGTSIVVQRWRTQFEKNYCSRACAQRGQVVRAALTCEQCGKVFEIKPSKKQGEHIFCSHHCAMLFRKAQPDRKVVVACHGCGIELRVYPSKLKTNVFFYCSRSCRARAIAGPNNPSYRSGLGRKSKYGPHWRQTRNAVLRRDNRTCQHCHKRPLFKHHLHVHHIIPFYTFNGDWERANELHNLITLCHSCHKLAEKDAISLQPYLL